MTRVLTWVLLEVHPGCLIYAYEISLKNNNLCQKYGNKQIFSLGRISLNFHEVIFLDITI